MLNRLVVSICAVFVLSGQALAGDVTRGLTITGGENALAALKLERVDDRATEEGTLTVRLSLSQAKNLKGYGLTLQYDPARYEFLEAREPDGNLLASGSDSENAVSDVEPDAGKSERRRGESRRAGRQRRGHARGACLQDERHAVVGGFSGLRERAGGRGRRRGPAGPR